MLALCTAVTLVLPSCRALSNANSAILIDFSRVIIFKLSTTPFTLSCSKLVYSPSVFSLIIKMSTSEWRVFIFGKDLHRITFAYRSNRCLINSKLNFIFSSIFLLARVVNNQSHINNHAFGVKIQITWNT